MGEVFEWPFQLLVAELLLEQLLQDPPTDFELSEGGTVVRDPLKVQEELASTLMSLDNLLCRVDDEGKLHKPSPGHLVRLWWIHGNFEEYQAQFQTAKNYFIRCEQALAQLLRDGQDAVYLPYCVYVFCFFILNPQM